MIRVPPSALELKKVRFDTSCAVGCVFNREMFSLFLLIFVCLNFITHILGSTRVWLKPYLVSRIKRQRRAQTREVAAWVRDYVFVWNMPHMIRYDTCTLGVLTSLPPKKNFALEITHIHGVKRWGYLSRISVSGWSFQSTFTKGITRLRKTRSFLSTIWAGSST